MRTTRWVLVVAVLLLAGSWTSAEDIAGLPLHVQKLAPAAIRVWLGDHISSTAVTAFATQKGIVVVDTFGVPEVDAQLRAAIARELGRNDFALLINTHEHSDHTGGNSVYADCPIVGHELVGPALERDAADRERLLEWYPARLGEQERQLASLAAGSPEAAILREDITLNRLVLGVLQADRPPAPPTVTFSDRMSLAVGDTTFDLSYIGGMHSASDIAVFVPEHGLLLTGDTMADVWLTDTPGCLAAFAVHPGIPHDFPRMLANWDRLLARRDVITTLLPGHWNGELSLAGADARVAYIRALWEGVNREYAEGKCLEEILTDYRLEARFPELANSPGISPRENLMSLTELWTVVSGQSSGARALFTLVDQGADESAIREVLGERSQPKSRYFFLEGEINGLGYAFLQQNRVTEAIRMLKLNVELFPDSWNVYDSLGEALLRSGDGAGATAMYEKSLAVNPDNANATEALRSIRENTQARQQSTTG